MKLQSKEFQHYRLERALTLFFFNLPPLGYLVLTHSKSQLTMNPPAVPDDMLRGF